MRKEKPMTKLQSFMNATGLSGASIARTLGVSTGTVSLVKNGKTDSISPENLKKFDDYIENYQAKAVGEPAGNITETADLKMVQFICDETIIAQEMGVIYGKAGMGKTYAIKHFVSTHPEAILIEVKPMMSIKSLLTKILDQQGFKNTGGNVEELFDVVIDNFKRSERVLIIDEAESLTTRSLETIRRINDFSQTPIILCGTYALLMNLKGRQGELLQLYSRISNKWEMQGLNSDDRTSLFGEMGEHIKRFTTDIRRSTSIFKKAKRFSQLANETLEVKHIKMATQSVILD